MFGKGGNIHYGEFIFIFLNILVFVVVLIFVSQAATGSLVYEEIYAKKIALMIDSAQPGTDIILDVSKCLEIAEKNRVSGESLKEIIKIDNERNVVNVNLGRQGSSSFRFFSDYSVVAGLQGDTYIIRIREGNDEG